jgi:hypothetical protein
MLRRSNVWNDCRIVFALSIVCLAVVLLAGCGSSSSQKGKATPTPTAAGHAVVAVPAGFTTVKTTQFRLSYPTGWTKQNPANGTGVQYQGPANQTFTVASLGNLPSTPQAFVAAFCSPAGFGGKPDGAAKTVKISGASWIQDQCSDAKGEKTAIVEATTHNNELYYMVYTSPTASFQADRSHYFNTMEQSFTFV